METAENEQITISLELSEDDFDMLCKAQLMWQPLAKQSYDGRFEWSGSSPFDPVWDTATIYYHGDLTAAGALLAPAYLTARGTPWKALWDTAASGGGFWGHATLVLQPQS